ncbi:hypothetical protein B0H14DRAFT_2703062, partial [Mycena olivaceomarginata]
ACSEPIIFLALTNCRPLLAAVPLLLGGGARLVAAQNKDNDCDNRPGHTSAVIGLVSSIIFLLLTCCGIQRRRLLQAARPYPAAAAAGPGPRPPLLRLSSSARFLHGMQYGQYNGGTGTIPYAPPPGPAPPGSEYPPAAAADWAPLPYLKEADGEAVKYPPLPRPPPLGFDATYAPPPGPRLPHTSLCVLLSFPFIFARVVSITRNIYTNSADFRRGFRSPPAS